MICHNILNNKVCIFLKIDLNRWHWLGEIGNVVPGIPSVAIPPFVTEKDFLGKIRQLLPAIFIVPTVGILESIAVSKAFGEAWSPFSHFDFKLVLKATIFKTDCPQIISNKITWRWLSTRNKQSWYTLSKGCASCLKKTCSANWSAP